MNQIDKLEAEGLFRSQLSNYLWDFGYYVDKRVLKNQILHLYSVDSKYYEMYFNSNNHIVKISQIGLDEIRKFYGIKILEVLNLAPEFEKML